MANEIIFKYIMVANRLFVYHLHRQVVVSTVVNTLLFLSVNCPQYLMMFTLFLCILYNILWYGIMVAYCYYKVKKISNNRN